MTEAQTLRTLAVAGLATALLVSAYIFFNSGVTGGAAGPAPAEQQLDAAAPAAPAGTAASDAADAGITTAPDGTTTSTTATTARSGNTYTVQSGDSFYTIARKYNTSIAEIQQLNPELDPSNLSTGTAVNVP